MAAGNRKVTRDNYKGRPQGYRIRDTLNKSLNASAFTPSFLRRQEPKTLWTEVPACAGTTY